MPQAKHAYTTPKLSLPRTLPPAARRKVEIAAQAHADALEALAAFLDKVDGDVDLEPNLAGSETDLEGGDVQDEAHDGDEDDEPSLAYTNDIDQRQARRNAVSGSDDAGTLQQDAELEEQCEDEGVPDNEDCDDADREEDGPPMMARHDT